VSLLPFRESTYQAWASTHVIIPGVATPGEAHQALDWGANLVKFPNPGLVGGAAFFRGMDAATHRGFPFFSTGGMSPSAIPDYVAAQVLVFGAGLDIILGADYEASRTAFDASKLLTALVNYRKVISAAREMHMPGVPFMSADPVAIGRASGRCLNLQ